MSIVLSVLFHFQGSGVYVWDDGWPFVYYNWAPNEPVIV